MIKIPHLKDFYKLKYQHRVPVESWELPQIRLFWANKFNVWQAQNGVSALPFDFAVAGQHSNGVDVLIVRLGESPIFNQALILAGKALIKFLNIS